MKWLTRKVSGFWLYPVVIFSGICLLPRWKSKSGRIHPLGTAYVNEFEGRHLLLLCHISATVGLSALIVMLHLWISRPAHSKK